MEPRPVAAGPDAKELEGYTQAEGLHEFQLRHLDHTDLFGIFMGVHALPGSVMLLHTTVGCKFKTQLHLVDHDWFHQDSHNERLWTGVDDARLIQGSGRRLIEFATTWYERRKPSVFVVTTNAAVELSSFDVEAAVAELRELLPCPVLLIKAPGYDGSLWRGYRRMLESVTGLLDWTVQAEPDRVALAGYLFDRFEMEHAANLSEIRRLLKGIGLTLSGTLLGGEPLPALAQVTRAAHIALLPYAHQLEGSLGRPGRRVTPLDLPVGLHGTGVFLRKLGLAAGLAPGIVEDAIERELARAVPLVSRAARRLSGVRVAVFLDTPMAAAVCAFLTEIGCAVPLVCLTDGDEGTEDSFVEAAARLGATFPAAPRIMAGPSRDQAMAAFREEIEREHVPLIVGSSLERAALFEGQSSVIEMGYPSVDKHFVYPLPWMGYNGAVALVQRFLDALGSAW
jgi:nitrogenase molybdenum-iron protein alpha/beta subunit